jgi:hypothetical protein
MTSPVAMLNCGFGVDRAGILVGYDPSLEHAATAGLAAPLTEERTRVGPHTLLVGHVIMTSPAVEQCWHWMDAVTLWQTVSLPVTVWLRTSQSGLA